MKALFKPLKIISGTLLFTLPQLLCFGSISSEKVLAQQISCPAGSTPFSVDWTPTSNLTGFLQQSFSPGGVPVTFNFTESIPGGVIDQNQTLIGSGVYGGLPGPNLRFNIGFPGLDPAPVGSNATLTVNFAQPLTLASPLILMDVDRNGVRDVGRIFQDRVIVRAFNNNSPVDVTLRALGPNVTVNGNVARGIRENAFPSSSDANVEVRINDPITQIQIIYEPGTEYGNPGQDETIGLAKINLCVPTGSIGDTVFQDQNNNRQQDSNEPGLPDVAVTLISPGPDNQLGTPDDTARTTTTDQNGKYTFSNLLPGNYRVTLTPPENFPELTTGNPQVDVNLGVGQVRNDVDFGLRSDSVTATGEPNLRLVKRITNARRNGQPISNLDFSSFIDDPNENDDNILQQAGRSPVGQINVEGSLRSEDELEYTIYFLAEGQQLQNTRFCDLIPIGTSYVPNSLNVNGITNQGRYLSPLTPLEDFANICGNNNTNGAVIVGPANIPSGQSGFIRFRVRIN